MLNGQDMNTPKALEDGKKMMQYRLDAAVRGHLRFRINVVTMLHESPDESDDPAQESKDQADVKTRVLVSSRHLLTPICKDVT